MTPQMPSLSREVHFVLPNGQHRTAKVINTHPRTTANTDPQSRTRSVHRHLEP